MARSINRLSDRTVKTISTPGRHADGGNLFLIVDPSKAKRWAFIYRFNGKQREMGLGSVLAVSLADARAIAGSYRGLLARGTDPIDARRAEQSKEVGRTFGEVATQLHQSKEAGWKNAKHRKQWLIRLERYGAPIWNKPVEDVVVADVLAILQPIWAVKAETASRIRGRIETVIDAARARGLIAQERANPARWRGHLSHLLPKRQRLQRGHHPALPYVDMPAFMDTLRDRPAVAALCLELLILTATRSSEAIGARWNEFDLNARVWTVPAIRMKIPKEHRIPLSDRSIEILAKMEPLKSGPDSFVFPGQRANRPLSPMALEMLLRRMNVTGATPHGFRSTFRDWCGEATVFPREVAEAALAHTVGNAVDLAYRRGDALEKRRALMIAWSEYCAGTQADNVVPIRSAQG